MVGDRRRGPYPLARYPGNKYKSRMFQEMESDGVSRTDDLRRKEYQPPCLTDHGTIDETTQVTSGDYAG
jgi:hypothetical protein